MDHDYAAGYSKMYVNRYKNHLQLTYPIYRCYNMCYPIYHEIWLGMVNHLGFLEKSSPAYSMSWASLHTLRLALQASGSLHKLFPVDSTSARAGHPQEMCPSGISKAPNMYIINIDYLWWWIIYKLSPDDKLSSQSLGHH